jgi:curli production assembly/transport component CsgF
MGDRADQDIRTMSFTRTAMLAMSCAALAIPAAAQQIVYRPINPTFGGDAFNSSHLLATAQAQNPYKERDQYRDRSEADLFAQQLQSRLLSALAGQVTEAIFGDNPQDSGTFTFGDQTVSFVRGLDAVNLTITNTATGATTTISIPSYVQLP